MSRQLLRSGTAIGALTAEAQMAQSRADFVHKLYIALKEANESLYWIKLLIDTEFLDVNSGNVLKNRCNSLVSILVKIIKTTKENGTGK